MKRSILFVLAALFAVCLGNVPVFGQSTGSIRGTVKDSQGGVVPNAKVTLVNSATNATAGRLPIGFFHTYPTIVKRRPSS